MIDNEWQHQIDKILLDFLEQIEQHLQLISVNSTNASTTKPTVPPNMDADIYDGVSTW